jgi:hypothetical protein
MRPLREPGLEGSTSKGQGSTGIETDIGDAATYEVHVTKSDGSQVTVKVDKSLSETGVETGNRGPRSPMEPG